MKKFSLIAFLLVALFSMNSCDDQFNSTPELDKTLLWPAQSDTCALWGYINERGEMVIPPTYSYAFGFSCGKAKVYLQDGRVAFIDQTGKIIHTFQEGEECDNCFYYGCLRYGDYIYDSNYYAYQRRLAMLNDHFKPIIPEGIYYHIGQMTKDGLAAVSLGGYYNKAGRNVIHKSGEDFCDGVAVIETQFGFFGAINTRGKIVIDTIYKDLRSVGNNRLMYQLKGGNEYFYGLMDTKGNIITEPIYTYFKFYGYGGLMPVVRYDGAENFMTGYIDKNGNIVIPITIINNTIGMFPFYDGVAWIRDYEYVDNSPNASIIRKLINMQGEVIITLKEGQENEGNFHNGLCLIHDNNDDSYQYINKHGEVIYCWKDNNPYYSPTAKKPAEMDEDEMMLRMFEGTEYYPLAEQCVRSRREREKQPR